MDETPAQQPGPAAPGTTPGQTPPPPGHMPPPAGQMPPADPRNAPSTGADGFFDSIRRTGLVRADERWVGGVAGGLALRLGIDPLIVRGLFGIGALLGGLGLVLYGIGWLLLPEQRDGRIHIQQLFRGDFDAAVIGGFAALLLGFGAPNAWGLPWWGGRGEDWWGGLLVVVAIVVVIVIIASNTSRKPAAGPTTSLPRTPPYGPPPPYAGAPYGAAPYGAPPAGPTPAAAPPRPTTYTQSAPNPSEGTPMSAPQAAPYAYASPGYAGYGQPVPPRPPVPSGPQTSLPKESTGTGARPVGIVVALTLIALAVLLYLERGGLFDHSVLLTTVGILVILCGLGIVVAGALGRTAGGLTALAVLALVVTIPIAGATRIDWSGNRLVGDGTYRPTDVAVAEDGYDVLAGDITIDLTDLPLGADPVEVPVQLTAGDLRVVLPEDGDYTARVRVLAGEFTWLGDEAFSGIGDEWHTFESASVADGAEPQIELELTVVAGTASVEEGR